MLQTYEEIVVRTREKYETVRFTAEVADILKKHHKNQSGVVRICVKDTEVAVPCVNEHEHLLITEDIPRALRDLEGRDLSDHQNSVLWRPGLFPKRCTILFVDGEACLGRWEDILLLELGEGGERTIVIDVVSSVNYCFDVDFWGNEGDGFGSIVSITDGVQDGLNNHVRDFTGIAYVKIMHTTVGLTFGGQPGWENSLRSYCDALVPSNQEWSHDDMERRKNVPQNEPRNGRGHLLRLFFPAPTIKVPVRQGVINLEGRGVYSMELCSYRPRIAKVMVVKENDCS